jgi:hypothetical protein
MQPKRDPQSNQRFVNLRSSLVLAFFKPLLSFSSGAVVIIQDESLRSMFGPQEPTVKILKRPTKTTDNQVTTDQPVRRHKTLQEVCLKNQTSYKNRKNLYPNL